MELEKWYYIYFYYDASQKPLYVGKSVNVIQRYCQHSKDCYFDQIKTIGIRKYASSKEMDLMETYYIQKLSPEYNKTDAIEDESVLILKDSSVENKFSKEDFNKLIESKTNIPINDKRRQNKGRPSYESLGIDKKGTKLSVYIKPTVKADLTSLVAFKNKTSVNELINEYLEKEVKKMKRRDKNEYI